jgi:hypothetical protein
LIDFSTSDKLLGVSVHLSFLTAAIVYIVMRNLEIGIQGVLRMRRERKRIMISHNDS